jgi:hypothetical protein
MPGPQSDQFKGQSGDTPVVPTWMQDEPPLASNWRNPTEEELAAVKERLIRQGRGHLLGAP